MKENDSIKKSEAEERRKKTITLITIIAFLIMISLWFTFTEEGKKTMRKLTGEKNQVEKIWDDADKKSGVDPHDLD